MALNDLNPSAWPSYESMPLRLVYFQEDLNDRTPAELAEAMDAMRYSLPTNATVIVVRVDGATLKIPIYKGAGWTGADIALRMWEFIQPEHVPAESTQLKQRQPWYRRLLGYTPPKEN